MKKSVTYLLTALLVLGLFGCGKQPVPETTSPETAEIQTEPATEAPTSDPAARAAFRAGLERLASEYIFPDGTEAYYDEVSGPMEDNKFAILDLDGDGREELILAFTTSSMAGMQTHVYGYDAETGSLSRALQEFPSLTFYTGGLVRADASHNHTLAGDTFWPHQFYQYNSETDVYDKLVFLDAWDRSLTEEDYEGNPYPEDVDVENAGIVYLIYRGQWGEGCEILSKSDFETWLAEFMGDAEKIDILYQNMTAENISAVTEN